MSDESQGFSRRRWVTVLTAVALAASSTLNGHLPASAATSFTSPSQTAFTVNQTGSFTVSTTGTTASINVASPLPIGLTLVDNKNGTAVLTGAPSVTGTRTVAVVAKRAGQPDETQNLTITVGGTSTAPRIATANTIKTPFVVGKVGLATVRAEGVPTPRLSVSGTLPPGLEFVDRLDGTAVIRGTPTSATASTVTVTASNGVGSPASQQLTIGVNATSPSYNGLALTPTLGMATWGYLRCGTNAKDLMAYAKSIVDLGLREKGYDIIQVDDCWQGGRDANGNLFAHPDRFPQGIKPVADYVHSLGLRFGMYLSPGTATCAEFYDGYNPSPGTTLGSFGHERQDADLMAAWDVDYVKDDWCRADANAGTTVEKAYTLQSQELVRASTAAKRPMFFAMSAYGLTQPWTWAKGIVNDWRVTDDQQNTWAGQMAGIDAAAPLASYVGPGHWNNISDTSSGGAALSETESLALFDMAAIMSVSALLDRPAASFSPALLNHVRNEELIAVHQDPLGRVATRVANNGGLQVWARPMANGDTAVTLLNNTGSTATISTTLSQVGAQPGNYIIRHLNARTDAATTSGPISATVASHGAITLRLRAGTSSSLPGGGVVTGTPAGWVASQGYVLNPWRYEFTTNGGASFSQLAYSESDRQWKGSEAWCAVQGPSQQHPGAGSCASSRGWQAPSAGTVTIGARGPIAVAAGCEGNTSGVTIRVLKNSTQVWPASGTQSIANGASFTFPAGVTAAVQPGDVLRFVVARNGSSISCDGTTWDPTVTTGATTWVASQGYVLNPWRYEFTTNGGASFSQLAYSESDRQWKGSEAWCAVQGPSQQHPGAGSCASSRGWQAPSAGTVTIGARGPIAVAAGCEGNTSGVTIRVLKNSTQVWPASGTQSIANGASFTFPAGVTAAVQPGDVLRFVVARNGSSISCDGTTWDPTVTTGATTWVASQGYVLNPWRYEFTTNGGASFSQLAYSESDRQWKGSEAWCAVQGPSQQHPGAGSCASSRGWQAPSAGTVTIGARGPIAVAAGCEGNTSGVTIRVLKNSTQVWPASGAQSIANGASFTFPAGVTAAVQPGDVLRFVVARNGTSISCDGTTWDPTVTP